MSGYDEMLHEIEEIVSEVLLEHSEVEGITISSHAGKNIFSKFRELKDFKLTPSELAAATTSLLFIATNMFERTFNQDVSYAITKGEKWILLCIINENISASVLFDRKLTELSGLTEIKNEMKKIFLKISAIIETSLLFKEDIFVQIKRAIPNALSIAIINKDGLPIKVQSTIDGTKLSAFIYALHQLAKIILDKKEYTIIGGIYGSIIIQQIDAERILGIGVPESDDYKLGKYIAKIQEIVKKINTALINKI